MIAAALRAVSKRFGDTLALDGVDLAVTALSILLGLRRPDAGRAEIFGLDPRRATARVAVGVTPQESGFPPTLRVREIVDLVRAHFPFPAAADEVLERFGLAAIARRQAGGLSGGERRRLSVALAFAGEPAAMFLDEPTAGLDVESRRSVWGEIDRYSTDGGTVLLTTHYLEEAERLATRIVLLARGRVVAAGTAADLASQACASGLEEAFLALTEVRA